ncbi:lipoprotein, partial [Neisseria dentiae]
MNKHLIALTAVFVLAACSSGVPKPQTLPQLQ